MPGAHIDRGNQACLLSLATAVPEHVLDQNYVEQIAERMFAHRLQGFEKLKSIFTNAGIVKRHSVRPPAWFEDDQGWPERNDAYIDGAIDLFRQAASEALEQAGLGADDIDTIVTVSSTGIATPTIEARAMNDMGFRQSVRRVPIFGLGCAGGVSGLAIADRLAVADPGSHVLLVVFELCTLSFRKDEVTKSNLVATALFGDGAAAAILSTSGKQPQAVIEHTAEHIWPETLNIMGWRIDLVGFGAIFDKSIPHLVETRMREVFEGFLARHHLHQDDITNYAFHPGGTKVIDALEKAFELPQGSLNNERDILRDFGNMSAPTVLFVLKKALSEGRSGRCFISALGPGFTASFATLQV